MTQAQLDLQTQLEQTFFDLNTQPLFKNSPVLFLDPIYQVFSDTSEQVEQTEQNTSSKDHTPPDNSHETPPPPKKKYEIMKDPIFLSSPIYPPILPSKPSLPTNCDDYLIPLLSHDRFTFKAQLTSFYLHPTDYTFRLYDKNQDFFTCIASTIMSPYQYWFDNGDNIFSLQFSFLRTSNYDLKTNENDPS